LCCARHGASLADYTYAEDGVGNITGITDTVSTGFNRTFAYDDLNRLITANSGASLWNSGSYTYDSMGNMKTLGLGSARTATFSYSGTLPKLTSVTENGTPRSVAYDAVGNETAVGTATYAYGTRNQLESGDALTYTYDGWGRRLVTSGSLGTRYSFFTPGMTLLSESALTISGRPAIAYKYIWFAGRPIAQVDGAGTHWTFSDHLGTPEIQTNSSGAIAYQAEYEPYGKVFALRSGDVHQPLRLPGQVAEQFDTGANGATERNYNVFRWYRPGWGRYSQADPIGLNGNYNLYRYVEDDPVSLDDPFGLRHLTPCEKLVLRPYIPQIDLNNANIHEGEVPWWLGKDYGGVTLENNIYFRPGVYDPTTSYGLALLGHESFHVGQYRTGMTRADYLWEGFWHGGGQENRYEKPAYALQRRIYSDLVKAGFEGCELCGR